VNIPPSPILLVISTKGVSSPHFSKELPPSASPTGNIPNFLYKMQGVVCKHEEWADFRAASEQSARSMSTRMEDARKKRLPAGILPTRVVNCVENAIWIALTGESHYGLSMPLLRF
jgi:hypothetical protein